VTSPLPFRFSQALLILSTSLGCGTEVPPAPDWADSSQWTAWHECEGAPCRDAIIRQVFQSDPTQAARWLELIDSPEEQVALVQVLVTKDPAKAGQLCPVIESTEARESCQRNTSRPHLYAPPPRNQNGPASRTAEGPQQTTLILPPNPGTRLSQLGANPGNCSTGDRACLMNAAKELASEDKGQEAARRCMAIDGEESWRGDCHFQAAEALALVEPIDSYGVIADLCRSSGQWAGRCVDKVNTRLAKLAPASNAAAVGWSQSLQAAHAITVAWAAEGPVIRDRIVMGFWAGSLAQAYAQSSELSGDPLDHLASHAIPHIRAALAWSVVQQSQQGTSMAVLSGAVQSALNLRVLTPSLGTPSTGGRPAGVKDLWETDGPGDGEIPSVIYMGSARRAMASTLEEDLQICILEAAVRQGPRWDPLIESARSSALPLVAWTAERLLKRIRDGDKNLQR
jgi:hypothetical protein